MWLMEAGIGRRLETEETSAMEGAEASLREMVQMDGSHHDCLKERAVVCADGYIDDATGGYLGDFYDYEGTFQRWRVSGVILNVRAGWPMSVYLG